MRLSPNMSAATVVFDAYPFEPANAEKTSAIRKNALAHARLGDGEAFAQIVQPYTVGLYRRALRMTGNTADAEDARQEALLKAFSRLNQFAGQQVEGKDDLHAWISRIAANASIDLIRQRRGGKLVPLEEPGLAPEETLGAKLPAHSDNPEELFARRELRRLLAGAIANLAPDLRQICLLRDVLQYSTGEVAARLRISTVAVRLRLFRAHRRLRDALRERVSRKPHGSIPGVTNSLAQDRARPKHAKQFAPMNSQAGFACGD